MDRFRSRSSAPSWWFGAPLFGVLFGMVANRFFPDFVASASMLIYRASGNDPIPAALSPTATHVLAPLVGTDRHGGRRPRVLAAGDLHQAAPITGVA